MSPAPDGPLKSQRTSKRTGRPKPEIAPEELLLLPEPPSTYPIVDTHTHLAPTHAAYLSKYQDAKYTDIRDFVKAMYAGRHVDVIVDVWCCEAEGVTKRWREFADGALTMEARARNFGGVGYWFAIGVHPQDARFYTDEVEKDILEAMDHPRCVSWGEIGLDYHFDRSPHDVQREVFIRQLRHAVRLGKTITLHTREADADMERILKAEVPKDHKIHVHCFSDSPDFALRLLDHFPNLYIGITGIITYSSNENTSAVIHHMATQSPDAPDAPLRIVLETDAPFMTPSNIYKVPTLKAARAKLPISHSAMIPWTAAFVARVAGVGWTTERVMREARENARMLYGI